MVIRTLVIRTCLVMTVLFSGFWMTMPKAAEGELINFEKIQGKWTGFGWLSKTLGDRERARCTVVVSSTDDPNKGNLELKCTTEQYELDARAPVTIE